MQDLEQSQAELYYFSGRAEECRNIAELYLQDKISVCACPKHFYILFQSYSGQSICLQNGIQKYSECLLLAKTVLHQKESWVFLQLLAMVLMHFPQTDFSSETLRASRLLVYVLAHNAYLHKNINGHWDYAIVFLM